MKKCPLNNFQKCDKECEWYLNDSFGCSVNGIANLRLLIELKSIERNVSSIHDVLNERLHR